MSDLNDRDLELLSAFVDGELTEAERTTLEMRMQDEPALRDELASLRQTVELVGSLPTLKAPRSFTLTPEQAGLAPRPRVLPFYATTIFSALSAAAAVVLVFLGVYTMVMQDNLMPAAPAALELAVLPTSAPSTAPTRTPQQRLRITPLPTLPPANVQGAELYSAAPAQARAANDAAADTFASGSEGGDVETAPEIMAQAPSGIVEEQETVPADEAQTGAGIADIAITATMQMPREAAQLPPPAPATMTAAPTLLPAPTPEPMIESAPVTTDNTSLALLIGGLVLFAAAATSTWLRQRKQQA